MSKHQYRIDQIEEAIGLIRRARDCAARGDVPGSTLLRMQEATDALQRERSRIVPSVYKGTIDHGVDEPWFSDEGGEA